MGWVPCLRRASAAARAAAAPARARAARAAAARSRGSAVRPQYCNTVVRLYSSTSPCRSVTTTCVHHCKLLVVGGGTGGTAMAWRFSRRPQLLKPSDIMVIEPSETHYYQPLFTLVAAGIKRAEEAARPTRGVLPPGACWCRDACAEFEPERSRVRTQCGSVVQYQYMIVALGLQNQYDKIPGLQQALEEPKSGVCSIYSPSYCRKTWRLVAGHGGGHAVFTYTRQAGKCAGAAQKIMYLADDYWRRRNVRDKSAITYNTGGATLFGVPKYADSLADIAARRCIPVNYNSELVEVTPCAAVFQLGKERILVPYTLLHVAPPMCPPAALRRSALADGSGFMSVDRHTLRHTRYPNVFGLGDCTNTPNAKTAAAVAPQSYVVEQNLSALMSGGEPAAQYDGYGSCPMLTSYGRGILAEFKYDKEIWETFPFDQSKERRLFYYLKTQYFPRLYWNKLLKGKFNGTDKWRKYFNPTGR